MLEFHRDIDGILADLLPLLFRFSFVGVAFVLLPDEVSKHCAITRETGHRLLAIFENHVTILVRWKIVQATALSLLLEPD